MGRRRVPVGMLDAIGVLAALVLLFVAFLLLMGVI